MKLLGNQFKRKLSIAYTRGRKAILTHAGEVVNDRMHKNVDRGVGFDGKKYAPYADRTKKDRKRLGYGTNKVDFQRSQRRIKMSRVRIVGGTKAVVDWPQVEMRQGRSIGQVMYYHQYGMGKNPVRHIFPEKDQDIPQTVHKDVAKFIKERLNEPVG
jgi:hypothetical protein